MRVRQITTLGCQGLSSDGWCGGQKHQRKPLALHGASERKTDDGNVWRALSGDEMRELLTATAAEPETVRHVRPARPCANPVAAERASGHLIYAV